MKKSVICCSLVATSIVFVGCGDGGGESTEAIESSTSSVFSSAGNSSAAYSSILMPNSSSSTALSSAASSSSSASSVIFASSTSSSSSSIAYKNTKECKIETVNEYSFKEAQDICKGFNLKIAYKDAIETVVLLCEYSEGSKAGNYSNCSLLKGYNYTKYWVSPPSGNDGYIFDMYFGLSFFDTTGNGKAHVCCIDPNKASQLN